MNDTYLNENEETFELPKPQVRKELPNDVLGYLERTYPARVNGAGIKQSDKVDYITEERTFMKDELVIYDEYGEKFTLDQFINEEVGSSLYKDKNHTDGFGDPSLIDWHKYYFTNDGLRFSKFEDFS